MKKTLIIVITVLCIKGFAQSKNIELGKQISNFSLINDEGKTWDLKNINSDFIVIYFYPAAMTSGCTKQACEYRDNKTTFDKLNVTVLGISGDEAINLKHFKEAYDLNFTLLSDQQGTIAKEFGVPLNIGGTIEREFNGKQISLFRGVTPKRWTFILDKNRKIVFKNEEVNPSKDTQIVKHFIEGYDKK